MMNSPNGKAKGLGSLLPSKDSLHQDALISASALLELMAGTNAMSFTRWKKERGMPGPVAHGKYSLPAMLRWIWNWRCQLEESLTEAAKLERETPTNDRRDKIKLEIEEMNLAKLKGLLVPRRDYEDAESARIALAIATLQTLPDRLIMAGLMPEASQKEALDLIGEAVDALQARIEAGDGDENQAGID